MSKKGCRYCKELFTGDCNPSVINDTLKINGCKFGLVDVFIDNDFLALMISNLADVDCMVMKTKQIRFCPFCGRALKEVTKV